MDEQASGFTPITMDDFHNIFSDKSESSIQKLKEQLDSLVDQDDWDQNLMIDCSPEITDFPELTDLIIYSACGYLCRKLTKFSKCQLCKESLLTKVETSNLEVAQIVNMKTKGFLMYCNLYLYRICRKTEQFFVQNVKFSDVYEKTLTDVFENIDLTFPCDEHKSDILAQALHYYVLMRMRQYEREENRSLKKKSGTKKKEAKLYSS